MKDIFQNSSSNWVRYNKYEWRTSADGKCYITPAADAKPSIYNPIKDYEKLVLTAINIGTTAMNKASESELKEAIMGFVSEYGMLGLMTALPTTPDFITYEAVYLPKIISSKKKIFRRKDICPASSLSIRLIFVRNVANPVGVQTARK